MVAGAGALAVVIALATPAWPETVSLRGAGSTFSAPLYKVWSESFHKAHPDVSVIYDSVGSGEGINRFIAGSVDFGASDRPPTEAEIAKSARGAVLVPVTAGMVVIAYSLKNVTGELKLPRDVYVDIFAGKIKNWSDPRLQQANPHLPLPRKQIALIGRFDSSGTTYAFTSHLAAISPAWRESGPGVGTQVGWPSNAMHARGNEGVARLIQISDGAIGYVEYGFAKRLGLPMATLANKSGVFVAPSEQSAERALNEAAEDPRLAITDPTGADAYPIVTFSWLLLYDTYKDQSIAAALRTFVTWGLAEGQRLGEPLGYVPLPPSVASRGREALGQPH
jgi:phosphate transport system substrate-binding protein